MLTTKPKIIFFGTPKISAYTLEKLIETYGISAVVTQPDKPMGRKQTTTPPEVKTVALRYGLTVYQPARAADCSSQLQQHKPDLGIVFAYQKILPKAILDIFPFGILNIHPSLLPKYRGPSPVPTAILSGEKITGVTIIKIDEAVDHGPILAQSETPIGNEENAEALLWRLTVIGTQLLVDTLNQYLAGTLTPTPQNDVKATFCKTITREDGFLDCSKTTQGMYRQFRALYPWPGVYTHARGKRIKIVKMKISENRGTPGTFFQDPVGRLGVYCADGSIIFQEIIPEGKKRMKSEDFTRGNKK